MLFRQKYEPQSVADLVICKPNLKKRITEYAEGQRTDHLMLFGPAGTGKSTAARVIAQTRAGPMFEWVDFFEGAEFKKADFATVVNSWSWQTIQGVRNPLVIINEVDKLTSADKAHLRAFIDTIKMGQLIVTTNNLHEIDAPLADRFDKVMLPPVDVSSWIPRAQHILNSEGVTSTPEHVAKLLSHCDSSIRDVISILEDSVVAAQ